MRLIAGDVGGTKTLLRYVDDVAATQLELRYDSTAYATFDLMLADFLARVPAPVDAACFAVAGPVFGGRAEITNIGWIIEETALARTFPIGRVSLINDFFAVALGVPLLADSDLLSLHAGTRVRTAPIAILGAGTGLGEAIVTHHGAMHHVIPSEGGHADFAPQDEEQARLFIELHQRYGHVSWERLLSGMGLVNLFTFLGGPELEPAAIAELADAGDPRGVHTFEIFADIYGAEAGNMALRVLARGGVYLAGGIAAKNVERFTDGRFVEAFLRKGRFRDLVATIPVDLIVNEDVGVIGALEGARRLVG
ncbi:MAG TPA: glucokinase [Thermoanaerobaculia bacterium]|nr:glucokinase [Thermoanaerobaculia bacterium]